MGEKNDYTPMTSTAIKELERKLILQTLCYRTWYEVELLRLIAAYSRKCDELASVQKQWRLLAEANDEANFTS